MPFITQFPLSSCSKCEFLLETNKFYLSRSLLGHQVFGQLVFIPEAAQRVHALQDVGVDVFSRGQCPDGHLPGDGLLRLRLILPGPDTRTKTRRRWFQQLQVVTGGFCRTSVPGDGGSTHRYQLCFWICSNWKTGERRQEDVSELSRTENRKFTGEQGSPGC